MIMKDYITPHERLTFKRKNYYPLLFVVISMLMAFTTTKHFYEVDSKKFVTLEEAKQYIWDKYPQYIYSKDDSQEMYESMISYKNKETITQMAPSECHR